MKAPSNFPPLFLLDKELTLDIDGDGERWRDKKHLLPSVRYYTSLVQTQAKARVYFNEMSLQTIATVNTLLQDIVVEPRTHKSERVKRDSMYFWQRKAACSDILTSSAHWILNILKVSNTQISMSMQAGGCVEYNTILARRVTNSEEPINCNDGEVTKCTEQIREQKRFSRQVRQLRVNLTNLTVCEMLHPKTGVHGTKGEFPEEIR
ncbi:hypothetical protein P5673_008645 [Acropora cervicornis]|uniref:Uncharacterized protein n=1 Tax=Acropora cervicornis TaxID=6130 RepID=A0AAD9QT38_ACRCE|nr:hypothetical protein P5673_008645 [Acropora cervicornis]